MKGISLPLRCRINSAISACDAEEVFGLAPRACARKRCRIAADERLSKYTLQRGRCWRSYAHFDEYCSKDCRPMPAFAAVDADRVAGERGGRAQLFSAKKAAFKTPKVEAVTIYTQAHGICARPATRDARAEMRGMTGRCAKSKSFILGLQPCARGQRNAAHRRRASDARVGEPWRYIMIIAPLGTMRRAR